MQRRVREEEEKEEVEGEAHLPVIVTIGIPPVLVVVITAAEAWMIVEIVIRWIWDIHGTSMIIR